MHKKLGFTPYPKRVESESYEDYVIRRKEENHKVSQYLKGEYVWMSKNDKLLSGSFNQGTFIRNA